VSGAPWFRGEGGLGGTSRKPDATEEGSITASVPMARREGWSRLRREGSVICGCSGHVKERCTKQIQEAPRVKVARPCEDMLEAIRHGELLLYPCKVFKAVCQERKRCN
jgi:hypothetical protein